MATTSRTRSARNTNTNTNLEDTMNTTDTNTQTVDTIVEESPEVTTEAPAVDNSLGIKWSEPPAAAAPKRQKGAKRAAVVAELQKHPGVWAEVKRNLKYTTETTEWRKLGCEVRHGKPEGSDLYSIWARWPLATDENTAK